MQIGWFEDLLSLIHAWTLTSVILYSVFYFLLFQATPLIRVCISASMLCYSYRRCISKLYVIAMELGWCEKFMIITMFQCLWLFTTWFVPVRSLLRRILMAVPLLLDRRRASVGISKWMKWGKWARRPQTRKASLTPTEQMDHS